MAPPPERSRTRLRITPWLATPALVAGCALALGIEEKERLPDGTAGGPVGTEDCHNGVDDDGDELTDCADPECSASMCAPPVPSGWLGPVLVRIGSDDAACDPSQAQIPIEGGLDEPAVPPAQCEPCACTVAPGGCSIDVAFHSLLAGCQAPTRAVESLTAGCSNLTPAATARSAWTTSTKTLMPCSPSGGQEQLPRPPISFEQPVHLCQSQPGGGCGANQICLPRPTNGIVGPCIYRAGDEACPTDAYAEGRAVHQVEDRRTCSPCTCPDLPDCSRGQAELYAETDCLGDAGSTISLDGSCAALPAAQTVGSLDVRIDSEHACTPAGGEGTTEVTTSTVTLCCLE